MATAAVESSLVNLPPAARQLVSALSTTDGSTLGKTDDQRKEVAAWIADVAQNKFADQTALEALDKQLVSKTYLVGNSLTVADVALYTAIHPLVATLPSQTYYSLPSLTRYFDHIQNHASVRSSTSSSASASVPAIVPFDLESTPKQERKLEDPKKDKKKKANDEAGVVEAAKDVVQKAKGKAVEVVAEATGSTAGKKEKKEKAKKEGAAAAPAAAEGSKKSKGAAAPAPAAAAADSGEPAPSMIDLRVGKIVHIEKHPDADGLYVEQIDLGEEGGPRTVVSGLVHYIPIEEMREKFVVAVCNLKPANMRGVKSHAMVLCATAPGGKEAGIELVQPPAGSQPGERVYFEGEKYEDVQPVPQLNPKKKIFETIQPGFTSLENHETAWIDPATKSVHRIRTKDGVCIAPKFVGASLS